MMRGGSLEGGMPLWKHNTNILFTALQNIIFKTYLSEYHSGFRAYSAKLLKTIPFEENSDSYVFDSEIIIQILRHNFRIDEIPIRTRYFQETDSLGFLACLGYGVDILKMLFKYFLHEKGIWQFKQFK